MTLLPDLNSIEYTCAGICLGIQGVILARRKMRLAELAIALIVMVPATLFAAASFTRFLGWDESYIFYDIVNYHTSTLPQWRMGVFRTSITLLGPLFDAIQLSTCMTKDVVLVLAKAAHWLTGVVVIAVLVDQLHSNFYASIRRSLFYAVLFNAIIMLPVTGLALKTLNYDLLSMLLGVLGCVWCIAGMQPRSVRKLFAGIICLALASHEKMIASPLLWIGMAGVVIRLAWPENKIACRITVARVAAWSIAVPAVALGIVVVSFVFVKVTHPLPGPGFSADQVLVSFSACLWPILHVLHFGESIVKSGTGTPLSEIASFARGFGLIASTVFFVAGIGMCVIRLLMGKNRETAITRFGLFVVKLRFIAIVLLAVTGVVSGYILPVKIWPLIPVVEGYYLPTATFNGIALHYGARTLATHSIASAAWGSAVFANALPTVLFVSIIIACMRCIVTRGRGPAEPKRVLLDLFAIFCILVPVAYGVLQVPLYPRYFNLYLLGAVVVIIPECLQWSPRRLLPYSIVCSTTLGLLIAECLPFQPLGAAFRPIWSNCSKDIMQNPSFGNVTPWYPGWGEELFAASGRMVSSFDNCKNGIRLYHNFPAALIRPERNVETSAMPIGHGQFEYRYSDCDYYILSRNGVSSFVYIPFPERVEPRFTIADRGFIKAWIFKGSDLKQAGFRFNEVH